VCLEVRDEVFARGAAEGLSSAEEEGRSNAKK